MSERTDFDFFHGTWRMHTRKLRDVMDPDCTEWVEFESTTQTLPVLGGLGNVEITQNFGETPWEAVTLRVFDPDAGIWRVWFISTRAPGYLGPADEGGFEDGRGVFVCDEELGGRMGKVRHQWSDIETGSPRWEQAFSFDGGQTWETNWVTRSTRIG